mgnify:CR=1 FL=1
MKFSPSAKSLATTKNNKAVGPVDTTLAGTTGSDVFAATRAVTLPKTAKPTSTQTGVPFFGSPFESPSITTTSPSTAMTSAGSDININPAEKLSTVDLQVNLGDLLIDTVGKTEVGGGCEPALTVFRGRLRLQGGNPNFGDSFKSDRGPNIPRNGEDVGANGINKTNQNIEHTINWSTKGADDYQLRAFNPATIYQYRPSTPWIAADMAVSAAIYWEVDGNQQYNYEYGGYYEIDDIDPGRDRRNFISDEIRSFFDKAPFINNFKIPFSYQDYHANPSGPNSKWFKSFSADLKNAVNKLGGDSGLIKGSFNDWTKKKYFEQANTASKSNKVDKIIGINLMFMIPVSAEFYDNLVSANNLASAGNKIMYSNTNRNQADKANSRRYDKDIQLFPGNELLATIKMSDDKLLNRTSTYVTFAFVPDKHPQNSFVSADATRVPTKYGDNIFKKRAAYVKDTSDRHEFRGGYDALLLEDKEGWRTNASKWYTATPGYVAGHNLFGGNDPSYISS